MNLIIFEGVMGSGKTLGMSIMAKYWSEKSNATLYSNYGLVGAKPFTKFSDFIDVAKQESSIICLDEAHIDLSSRDFNTNNVKFFTNIVFYLRKLRCTLVMTSPLIENIDSRVRNVTNLYCPVRNDRNYFYYPFYDYQLEKYLKTKRIRKIDAFKISEQIFDTYSMVTPLEYPSSRQEFIDLLEQLKRENALYLARKASTTA